MTLSRAEQMARPDARNSTAAQPDTRPAGRAKAHLATGRKGPDTAVDRRFLDRRADLPLASALAPEVRPLNAPAQLAKGRLS